MESIGEYLRMAREERKIPIAQVSRDTKIGEKYIAAMENGEFAVFPALTYARGFLRIYAEYLGLDPKPLVEQLLDQQEGLLRQPFTLEGASGAERMTISPRMFAAAGVAAAIVALAGVLYSLKPWRELKARPAPPRDMEEIETLPLPALPAAKPAPESTAAPAPAAEAPAKKMKLAVKARENVMMKVYADGVLLFQGTLRKGKEEFWLASEGFDCRVGRARAVELSLDGKPIGDLKGREAQNVSIDREGKISFYKGKLKEE